jgi:anti-sigma regulatory factor (Ser/Thr protein kinase)
MSHSGTTAWGRGRAAGFHTLDSEGFGAVARFVAAGWDRDECVVVVATGPHRVAVDELLVELGHDPAAELAAGRYLTFDAEETLAELVVDGRLDVEHLLRRVDEVVARVSATGRPIRAFGEMVALLWQRRRIGEAVALELLWSRLLREHDFSLLCAYPTGVLDHAELVDVRRVCDLHTDLRPVGSSWTGSARLAEGHACSRAYPPRAESVPAARHFVVGVLRAWGHEGLAADAALIVSELATNALTHAASPFRVVVDRHGGGVRIGVEDAALGTLERRAAELDDVSGRGVAIVAALSDRWGYGPVPGGKVVWAELLLDPSPFRAG